MAQVVEMVERADFGVDGDRSPPPAPTELILNTVALSLISPREEGGRCRRQRAAPANMSVRAHICEYGACPLRHSCAGRNPGDRPTPLDASALSTFHRCIERARRAIERRWTIEALAMASDRMDSCLRRNDGRLGMAQVVEMVGRADFGVDGDRSPPPAPTELILNTVALSLISPRRAGAEGGRREHLGENSHLRVRSRPPPSFLRRQESMRPPNNPWRLGTLDVPPMYRTRALGDQAPSDDRSPCDALRSPGFLPAQE